MAVAVAAVAQSSAAETSLHEDPPASCTAELDAFCGNPSHWVTGAECYASIHKVCPRAHCPVQPLSPAV